MKNLSVLLIVFTIISVELSAQSHLRVGIFGGSVTNQFVGDRVSNISEMRFKFGNAFQSGIMVDYAIKKDVSLAIYPSFKQSKGTILEENLNYDPDLEMDDQFIETQHLALQIFSLPIELKLISDNRKWQFFTGLTYDQIIKATSVNIQSNQKSDISNVVENFNVSATIGLGYRLQIKNQLFTIDIRYAQGLVNVSNVKSDSSTTDFPRLKTTSAESRLTWVLPFGNRER